MLNNLTTTLCSLMRKDFELNNFKVGEFYLHKPSGTIGRLKAIHEPGDWKSSMGASQWRETSPEGLSAPSCGIVEFETGDAFVNNHENFRLLNEKEVAFYALVRLTVQKAVSEIGSYATSSGLDMDYCIDTLAHVLALQSVALK